MSAFDAPPPEAELVEEGEETQLIPHRGEKPRQLVIVNDAPGDEIQVGHEGDDGQAEQRTVALWRPIL